METMKMNKKEAVKLINEAYSRLSVLNNLTWTPYRDNLFNKHREEEKQHDQGRPEHVSRGLSIVDSARLFTVCWIAEYLTDGKRAPEAQDYINMRPTAFYAYSVAMKYKDLILKAWKGLDVKAIAELDYAKLQEVN